MPESRIWEAFFQVCSAVAILHDHKPVVVHRDIKAENILICEDGSYKLCDFGSAKTEMVFPAGDTLRNEIAEDIDRFTTMVYRAPEMLDLYMEKWIGDKVDIWALGCLLFKMAYVVTPFEEAGRLGILNARVEFPQTLSSSSYSENLRSTIKWLLTPDPEERPDIFDVLERIAPYARVSYSRNGKVGPKHPADPAGYGESVHSASSKSSSSNAKKSDFMSTLDWQSSDSSSKPQSTSKMHDFFDTTPSHDAFESGPNSFFSAPSPQIAFDTSSVGSSDWASFGNDSSAMTSQAPSFNAFDTPTIPASTHQQPPDRFNGGLTPVATSSSSRLSAGSGRSHRRSVSDSSAITASLANMQIASAAFSRRPVTVDIARIPTLINAYASPNSAIPSNVIAKELIAYSWASPKEQHVSKLFQNLAPLLGDHPATTFKGLNLIHRLIAEGSGLVLTLCINKLEWFRSLQTKLSSQGGSEYASLNVRYATYLVKRLEFHQAFEGCYEGSFSLDLYFAKLRTEGKKLQIGAADSPFRRQAVPSLLECQSHAIALADSCLTPSAADPSASSLKLHLSLVILSDLCAVLLALQLVTTKLLATKTDFTKAIAQYDEHYPQMIAVFKTFQMVATQPLSIGFPATELNWAKSIKIPSFSPAAPPIVKNSTASTASPPSVDPSLKSSTSMPNSIIFEPLTDMEQAEIDWLWQSAVLGLTDSSSNAQNASPAFVSPAPAFVSPAPALSSSGGAISRNDYQPSFNVEHLRVSGSFSSQPATSSSPLAPSGSLSPAPSFPQAYSPPPVFVSPTSVPTSSTPSFDPFNGDSLSLSGSGGFTHGDPFQMAPSSSAPAISINSNMNGGFGTLTASASGPSDLFAPSGSQGFHSQSPAPAFHHGAAPFSSSPAPTFATTFDNSDPFIVAPSAIPAKRQLAASADHQGSFPTAYHKSHSHKKRSENHSGSSDAASWGPSPGLTSEDKLKNKDYISAQANEFSSIQSQPANSKCFDCGDNLPKWISINLGVFICYRCSGIHRSFGTHISKVRSIDLDVLTPEQISVFRRMGNAKAARIWLANVPDSRNIPDRNTSQTELERFLRDKYVFEEFKDKDASIDDDDSSSSSSYLTPTTSKKRSHTRTKSHQ